MVPTGMPAIDQNLGGGLGKKKFGLVCGQTGLGKTALGINFAIGAARLGFRAVIASLEIPEEEMFCRIYANVARYPYDLILKGDRTGARTYEEIQQEVQQRVMSNFGNSCGNLAIWDMSDGTTPRTVAGLKKKLMDDRAAGFSPDVLIVDWLDIMDLSEISKKSSPIKEVRHKLQKNAEELDQMARDENIAIWSMTQANSQADGKSKVTMKNNSEGYSKSFKSSVFLGIGASYQDREENIFTVTCSKARDGRLFTCRIRAILDQQRFEEIDDTTTDPLSQMLASSGDLAARTDFSALTTE
jgi:replicative DNA helicase